MTAKAFERMGVDYQIVVEPQEAEQYISVIDTHKVRVLPFSNLGQGSIPARNWVWEDATRRNYRRHWIVDDNIRGFYRFNRNLKVPVADGTAFRVMEDFTDRYSNVPMAGPNYFMFVKRKTTYAPFTANTRIYSCILLSNEPKYHHRWRGKYNEDTDLSLRYLKDGLCTILFNAFLAEKSVTMKMKGGNTDELYSQDNSRWIMAESLRRQHPDVVRVSRRWGRWQHSVDYRPFRTNKLVRKPGVEIPTEPNEYGMVLIKRKPINDVANKIHTIKSSLLKLQLPETAIEAIYTIGRNNKKPLGKFSPWAWCLEPTRGCNLRCWHCPVSTVSQLQSKYQFMSRETWINTWNLIKTLTPRCRVEMANTGEPTMHPTLPEFISIARSISPYSQIQITTNGTRLFKNEVTYRELFSAGANIVYVDMYASEEKHVDLARRSGYKYFSYYDSPKTMPNPWTYHNDPKLQMIVLSQVPDKWPKKKIRRGALGTFLNNIKFDTPSSILEPTTDAPYRRCNQPQKYVQVMADGTYLMCCQDAMNEAGLMITVNDGLEGFFKHWFGDYMQRTRTVLHTKNRKDHELCKRCSIIFSRCDIPLWKPELFEIKVSEELQSNGSGY